MEMYCDLEESISEGTNPVSKHTLKISGMVPMELAMTCRNGLSLI